MSGLRAPARVALIWLAASSAAAGGQAIVTSAGPSDVDVTIYREPDRNTAEPFELRWLGGYALISETRQVTLPAGQSEIRFEGVAGGIVPQSAIVRGFPDGIVERNRDAYLLSPESLLDRSLGRRVHLRRTSRATGRVREQEAIVRSGSDGAVVLETADGIEALRCTGLAETPIYDRVPPGLAARPTLSVLARSSRPVTATINLSYLASGFDWQANYVATLSPAGDRADLFAWLTLASDDETSFRNADTQAVAGRLNREHVAADRPQARALTLQCWPEGRTDQIPFDDGAPPPPPEEDQFATSPVTVVNSEEVRLSGTIASRDLIARQEDLGDVKLYRIPEPVTVAANSQKQVAFLRQSGVAVALVYRQRIDPRYDSEPEAATRVLVTRNRREQNLGLPLPAGRIQLFATAGGRPILIGEGAVGDRAVGDDVEIELGDAPGVVGLVEAVDRRGRGGRTREYRLVVTNDQIVPVRYEAEFAVARYQRLRSRARLERRDGRPLWAVTIPANGAAVLRYRVTGRDE